MRRNQGSVLIEILISLSLGSILMLATIQLFLTQKRFYDFTQASTSVLQNAYWASTLLQQAIYRAGYMGCMPLDKTSDIRNTTTMLINAKNYLETDGNQLTVRYMSPQTAIIQQDMDNHYQLITDKIIQFKTNDIIVIADCQKVDIVKIAHVDLKKNQQYITLSKNSRLYSQGTQVGKYYEETYSIADSQRKNQKGKSINSLILKTPNHHDELIEGVDQLSIQLNQSEQRTIIRIKMHLESLIPVGFKDLPYQHDVAFEINR